MKAIVYQEGGSIRVEDRPKPTILEPTDAIVKIVHTTICGTDLHILKGDVATCTPGRILGHEGVGVIDSLGAAVAGFSVGQTVIISCITSCGICHFCRRGMSSQCASGGWILGNTIDGTQAEYVRIPHASFSLHHLPESVDPKVAVALSDVVPTAYECGILNGQIQPGSSLAIIGTGPIGLMALQMARNLFGPAMITMVGRGQARLDAAGEMGAHHTLSMLEGHSQVVDSARTLCDGKGFDVVIEAVGTEESFEMAQALVGAGGTIASLGVFGQKCDLHLEHLWHRNICIKTRLVDASSTPDLLRMVGTGIVSPDFLVSHSFSFADANAAYETFEAGSNAKALKVVISL